jgi:hypothetical protein
MQHRGHSLMAEVRDYPGMPDRRRGRHRACHTGDGYADGSGDRLVGGARATARARDGDRGEVAGRNEVTVGLQATAEAIGAAAIRPSRLPKCRNTVMTVVPAPAATCSRVSAAPVSPRNSSSVASRIRSRVRLVASVAAGSGLAAGATSARRPTRMSACVPS